MNSIRFKFIQRILSLIISLLFTFTSVSFAAPMPYTTLRAMSTRLQVADSIKDRISTGKLRRIRDLLREKMGIYISDRRSLDGLARWSTFPEATQFVELVLKGEIEKAVRDYRADPVPQRVRIIALYEKMRETKDIEQQQAIEAFLERIAPRGLIIPIQPSLEPRNLIYPNLSREDMLWVVSQLDEEKSASIEETFPETETGVKYRVIFNGRVGKLRVTKETGKPIAESDDDYLPAEDRNERPDYSGLLGDDTEMEEIAVNIAGISSFLKRYPNQTNEVWASGVHKVIQDNYSSVPEITKEQLSGETERTFTQYASIVNTLRNRGFTEVMIEKLNQAFVLALWLHNVQKRAKKDSRPYFIHSAGVANILVEAYSLLDFIQDKNEVVDILSAAFLHDAIEDAVKGVLAKSEIPESVEDKEMYLRNKVASIIRATTNQNMLEIIQALTKIPEGTEGLDEYEIEKRKIRALQTAPLGTRLIKMADWHFNFGDLKNSPSGEFTEKFVRKRLPLIIEFLHTMVELPNNIKATFVRHLIAEGESNNTINSNRGFDGVTMTGEQIVSLKAILEQLEKGKDGMKSPSGGSTEQLQKQTFIMTLIAASA